MPSVTVLIVASPIPSHPSSQVLDKSIESLRHLRSAEPLNIVISHDRPKPCVSRKTKTNYTNYLSELQVRYSGRANTTVVLAPDWGHLSGNIAHGLSYVSTKFVLVLQHDFFFVRDVQIDLLAEMMESYPEIKHIRFNKRKNWPAKIDAKDTHFFAELTLGGISLCRTSGWSDNPHLTTKRYYKDFIFPQMGGAKSPPETICNPRVTPHTHNQWGTYIFGGLGQAPFVDFVDGRKSGQSFIQKYRDEFGFRLCSLGQRVLRAKGT